MKTDKNCAPVWPAMPPGPSFVGEPGYSVSFYFYIAASVPRGKPHFLVLYCVHFRYSFFSISLSPGSPLVVGITEYRPAPKEVVGILKTSLSRSSSYKVRSLCYVRFLLSFWHLGFLVGPGGGPGPR